VAFDEGIPVGFGALKAESIPSHRHLTPWAAAGFVLPERRGQGIGALLLRAIVDHAGALGFEYVHCATSTSVSLLHRAGWHAVEEIVHAGQPLVIFRSGA
jgi:GNAT superfamily N-acetyltransferase